MRSTFMGLETSKKGLFVQQSALYTTGHNISNANTEGYTRQRVNMQATPGFPYPGLNSPKYPGHLGTGVEVQSIQRMRDEFIDRQYRQETNKLGYWDSKLKSINQMEDILAEPSEFGINQSFTDFWKSLQDLSTNPEDPAARKVVLAKGTALADAFNYNYKQLQTIQSNLGNEIAVETRNINSILEQVASINAQIKELEPNGYVTNDLYDARDLLVDELNSYLPVTIERVPSGGMASAVAEGSLTVRYEKSDGTTITLVDGKHYAQITTNGQGSGADGINSTMPAQPFTNITVVDSGKTGTSPITASDIEYSDFEPSEGKLLALIDAYGRDTGQQDANGNPIIEGTYPEMLQDLDKLTGAFITVFNEVHKAGYGLNTTEGGDDYNFFSGTDALTIKVAITDINQIAASSGVGEEGNGKWAMELSNLQFLGMSATTTLPTLPDGTQITFPAGGTLDGATFQKYYESMIGNLAVQGEQAIRLQYNSGTQLLTIANNRASHSSVSLDEEMTNMITFQQAYNANARMITVVDETLDKIINGMGRVGL